MGLFSKDPEKANAIQTHRNARENLARVSARNTEVTQEVLDANRAVIDAEKDIPWWRR